MLSQLRYQRLLSRESAPTQPRDDSLSACLSESVIPLISTCQQVEECLLSCANCISQPVDLLLVSPAFSTYSAARSVSVSRLISACQPVDQDLSASRSAPTKMRDQLRDQRLLSRESAPTQPRYHSLSASLSESVIRLISTCQQFEECLLSRANCISQPVDLLLLSPAIIVY